MLATTGHTKIVETAYNTCEHVPVKFNGFLVGYIKLRCALIDDETVLIDDAIRRHGRFRRWFFKGEGGGEFAVYCAGKVHAIMTL